VVEYDVRKVLRVGMKSVAITIPKKWARELGLEPGSSVDVIFDGNRIVVKPQRRSESEEEMNIFIEVKGSIDTALRKLIASYIEGVTRVRIKASYSEAIELGEKLKECIPLAVVVAKPGSMYHDVIFTDYGINLRDILDKLASTTLEALSKIERGEDSELSKLYQDFIKSYALCMRIAKRILVEGAEQPLDVVDSIIFTRYLREIIELLTHNGVHISNNLSYRTLLSVIDFVKTAIRSYIENDIDTSLRLLEKANTVINADEVRDPERRRAIEKLRDSALNIAELSLERCIRNKACRCRYFYPKI